MPIDPNTGMYVDPLGTSSPGGMGTAALSVLSNMLATNLAATRRQENELDLAKKQHEYDRQLQYENDMANVGQPFSDQTPGPLAPPEDQQEQIAIKYAGPTAVLSNLYRRDYNDDRAASASDRLATKQNEDRDKKLDLAEKRLMAANATNSQAADYMQSQGLWDDNTASLFRARPKEPFSGTTASKVGLNNATAGLATARTKTEDELRDARKKDIEAKTGLAAERLRISKLKNTVQALKDAQDKGAGKVDARRFDALRREKEAVIGKIDTIRKSLRGNAGLLVDEQARQEAEESINELQSAAKEVESEMSRIKTSVDFSDVIIPDPGTSVPQPKPVVQPNPVGVNTRTAVPTQSWEDYVKKLGSR